jgi:GntR family transcriptional regulator, arabinose operon transcriptional repressor
MRGRVTKESKTNTSEVKLDGTQPKYRFVSESLKRAIVSGEYAHGSRLPSEVQLVRRFGASRMTIVKAVKELQLLGLVVRRVGSGTYVSSGSPEDSYQFGLLIPNLGNAEIFEPICQGMANSALARPHSLIWGRSISESEKREEAAQLMCQQYIDQRVSGVFFAPLELTSHMNEVNRRIISDLERAKIPIVLLDRSFEPYPIRSRCDLVGIDNRGAAHISVEHLIKRGARRVAFFAKQFSAPTIDARISGYRDALWTHSLLPSENLVTRGDPTDEALVASVLRKQKPDAFLCGNDHTAALLMQALLNLDVKVPEQVRIVGMDDVKYASLLPIPLTTQHQPCLDIGLIAMKTMLDRLQNPSLPVREITLSCELVIRKSCGREKAS